MNGNKTRYELTLQRINPLCNIIHRFDAQKEIITFNSIPSRGFQGQISWSNEDKDTLKIIRPDDMHPILIPYANKLLVQTTSRGQVLSVVQGWGWENMPLAFMLPESMVTEDELARFNELPFTAAAARARLAP